MKNKERHLKSKSRISALCLLLLFSLSPVYAHPWPGSGTEADPFLISDANGMQAIGADANYWSSCFKLVNDIDLSQFTGSQYNIIGNTSIPFSGIFDGNLHTIYNFTYESNGVDNIGLFGSLIWDGKIRNLNLVNVNINAGTGSNVGSIAGSTKSLTDILNCSVQYGSIAGNSSVGGIVGCIYTCANVHDCIVRDISISGAQAVGGIVGYSEGYILNCESKVDIRGTEVMFAGGICGQLYTNSKSGCPVITGCWSHCDITVFEPGWIVGGGGILGIGSGMTGGVDESYAEGMIYGSTLSADIGGLIGILYKGVSNSYSTTTLYGGSVVGGLIGYNEGSVDRCFSAGLVSSPYPEAEVYGFVGGDRGGTYTRCFWDQQINPPGMGSGTTSTGVVGKTTAEMKTKSTFTSAYWDFNNIWAICEGTNYPKLIWQIPSADLACPDGVNFIDYSVLSKAWLADPNLPNWDPNSDISEPNDLLINVYDLDVFADQWLTGIRN